MPPSALRSRVWYPLARELRCRGALSTSVALALVLLGSAPRVHAGSSVEACESAFDVRIKEDRAQQDWNALVNDVYHRLHNCGEPRHFPPAYFLLAAQASVNLGQYDIASKSLKNYFEAATNTDPAFQEAITLKVTVDKELDAQYQRRQAEAKEKVQQMQQR
jgi:hypothetical protein